MDAEQLRERAMAHALKRYAGEWIKKQILELIAKAGGSVEGALDLARSEETMLVGRMLGNFRVRGNEYWVECKGSAPKHPIEAWFGSRRPKREPDVVIEWETVFWFVQGIHQPRLL